MQSQSPSLARLREQLERLSSHELAREAVEYDWRDAEFGRYQAHAALCRAILRERGARVPAREA